MRNRRKRSLALLLMVAGLALAVGGCAKASSRVLDALWYRVGPNNKTLFGVTRHRAMVDRNSDQEVRVGVFEQYVGATGLEWRTSVWLASFLATQLLGKDLNSHRFSIAVGGFIDGPSAGALMAAGFTAAITGASIRSDVTMTGALSPDGSVAPVGGIPHKIRAAQRAGKKVVGIPRGQSKYLASDGREIDVVRLGRSLGVEVVEVSTLRDAYHLLTGAILPEPPSLPRKGMSLNKGEATRLAKEIREMAQRAAKERLTLEAAKLPELRAQLEHIDTLRKEAIKHLDQGNVAASYAMVLEFAARARSLTLVQSMGKDATLKEARKRCSSSVGELESDIASLARARGGKALVLLSAASNAARARGYLELAKTLVAALAKRTPPSPSTSGEKKTPGGSGAESALPTRRMLKAVGKTLEETRPWTRELADQTPAHRTLRAVKASARMLVPATYLGYAQILVEQARDLLATFESRTASLKLIPKALQRTSGAFSSAASGNIEYIDALLLREVAKQQGRPLDTIREAFALSEHSYLVGAQLAARAVQRRVLEQPEVGPSLLSLAESLVSYMESAVVVAKYYSLGGLMQSDSPKQQAVARRNLLALLGRAEVAARRAAARAVERFGIVPPGAKIYYQAAMGLQRGDTNALMTALSFYWRSTSASRAAAMVVRKRE